MMMLSPDKKKMASVILGKLGEGAPAPEGPEQDASAGLEAAMQKLISCVHSKDVQGGVSALSDFLSMHEGEPDGDEGLEG